MSHFNKACNEILEEMKITKVTTKHEINRIKISVINKYKSQGMTQIPKNSDIFIAASDDQRKQFNELLSLKPVRTISGVAPIALMSDPYPCPHTMKGIGPCTYCPGGPGSVFGNMPQSYTGKEPSTRRSIRNNYDPYLIVFNRLEHYIAMGKIPDKVELIIQGGTFTFFPRQYQEYFVKYALKAMNDFSSIFFDIDGELDILKFRNFFELPRTLNLEDERTKTVQQKLLYIKNFNLNNFNQTKIVEDNSEHNSGDNIEGNSEDKMHVKNILAMKRVQQKLKIENSQSLSLNEVQKQNETSFIRCVGLTIETKSDFGKLYHGNLMLELGCTRVEIGIQSIYNHVLEATNRGNTVADNIESIRILKEIGFKINSHYMPGLPYTTKEMDLHGLRQLFENPDYRPDLLKIYPCMVMEGTKLYEDWKAGKFNPLTTSEAAEIISEAKRYFPEYVRIVRIQRDIPTNVTSAGVDKTNLRQYVEKLCIEKNIKCRCIRCREAGFDLIKKKNIESFDINNIELKIIEYEASNGIEFFISAEDVINDVLIGYCRLRFPSQFLRPEITENSALVRELHVYSSAVQIGKKSEHSFQHRGIGKRLMEKAEEITKQHGKKKLVVLSGIGAKQYFLKLGYSYDGCYMSKCI